MLWFLSNTQTLTSVKTPAVTCVTTRVWTQWAASCVTVTAASYWPRTSTPASHYTTVSLCCFLTATPLVLNVGRLTSWFAFCVAVSSSGKSDTLMSSGTCSFTCQDFLNMKNSLLQLKLKLANRADKQSSGRAGKLLEVPCRPGLSGPPGGPGLPGKAGIQAGVTWYIWKICLLSKDPKKPKKQS